MFGPSGVSKGQVRPKWPGVNTSRRSGTRIRRRWRGPGQPVGVVEPLAAGGQEGGEPVLQWRQGPQEGAVEGGVAGDLPESGLDEGRESVAETVDSSLGQVVPVGHGRHDQLDIARGVALPAGDRPRGRQGGPAVGVRGNPAAGRRPLRPVPAARRTRPRSPPPPNARRGRSGRRDPAGPFGAAGGHPQPCGQQLGQAAVQKVVEGRLVPRIGRCSRHV